jgi:hypothetical protein
MSEGSENPVSPEDILGIKKDPAEPSLKETNGREFKVSPEMATAFKEFIDKKDDKTDERVNYVTEEDKLLAKQVIKDIYGQIADLTRTYYRVDDKEGGFEFTPQSEINFQTDFYAEAGRSKYRSIMLKKFDVSPETLRGRSLLSETNEASRLQIYNDSSVALEHVLGDQLLEVLYRGDSLLRVAFLKIEESGKRYDKTTYRNVPFNNLIVNQDGVLYLDLYENKLRRRQDPEARDWHAHEDFEADGRRVRIITSEEEVKVIFSRTEDPEIIDYEIAIPKVQELEDFVTKDGKVEKRYRLERDLIPERLRDEPATAPSELDEVWKRADFPSALGIRIDRNVRP